ncbi:MAG: hypothetical protein Q7J54_00450 [Candidatus Woesearchaeota archaeon]|nr:hypothetical protein [Candidatus Woesearchaeota archaeon]
MSFLSKFFLFNDLPFSINSVSLTNSSSNSAFSAALKLFSTSVLWNFLIVMFIVSKAGIVSFVILETLPVVSFKTASKTL